MQDAARPRSRRWVLWIFLGVTLAAIARRVAILEGAGGARTQDVEAPTFERELACAIQDACGVVRREVVVTPGETWSVEPPDGLPPGYLACARREAGLLAENVSTIRMPPCPRDGERIRPRR